MRPLITTLKVTRVEIPCFLKIAGGFVIFLKCCQGCSQAEKGVEVLWFSSVRFAEASRSFPISSKLREQHPEVVVAHGRVRLETNYCPETFFRLLRVAEFAGRETLEVVKRRIASTGGNGIVYGRECIGRLAGLQKSECLIESVLRVGCLGRRKATDRGRAD